MLSNKSNILIITTVFFTITGCSYEVSYERDVNPIFESKCLVCHDGKGEGSKASGFNVLNYEDVMEGTKFGPVVVPGDSVSSTLYRLIAHKVDSKIQMPPHHVDTFASKRLLPLEPELIAIIEKWIDQGAKDN
jgi:hypothetical protein